MRGATFFFCIGRGCRGPSLFFVCAPWARSNGCHLSLGMEVAGTSVPIKYLINVGSMLQLYLYVSINFS